MSNILYCLNLNSFYATASWICQVRDIFNIYCAFFGSECSFSIKSCFSAEFSNLEYRNNGKFVIILCYIKYVNGSMYMDAVCIVK